MELITDIPLVVDLDGTLIYTDTLHESAVLLFRRDPVLLLSLPRLLLQGRAVLKTAIAGRVVPDAQHLPYRQDLVDWLIAEKTAGRKVVLATAAHRSIADAVAAHLGVFDEVIATDGAVNLKGETKRDVLIARFGLRGFDYVGDSAADEPVWAASRIAHLAGRKKRLPLSVTAAGAQQGRRFGSPSPDLKVCLRAMRVYQWVKNVLIFLPALLSHHLDIPGLVALLGAALSFSLIASGTYVINDLLDLEADRGHQTKRRRPFASGRLSVMEGALMAFALISSGFGLSAIVGMGLSECLVAYMALTLLYSSFLKNKPIIDVVVLAALYTLRLYAGSAVTHVRISPWLFQFSIFLFLSLAFVKRYSELLRLVELHRENAPGRGYRPPDLGIVSQAGVGSGLMAGLVLALYVNGADVQKLYPRSEMLWGIVPLFIYWIIRVWLVAHRGNMSQDPILFAFRDRVSYIVGVLIVSLAVVGATSGYTY